MRRLGLFALGTIFSLFSIAETAEQTDEQKLIAADKLSSQAELAINQKKWDEAARLYKKVQADYGKVEGEDGTEYGAYAEERIKTIQCWEKNREKAFPGTNTAFKKYLIKNLRKQNAKNLTKYFSCSFFYGVAASDDNTRLDAEEVTPKLVKNLAGVKWDESAKQGKDAQYEIKGEKAGVHYFLQLQTKDKGWIWSGFSVDNEAVRTNLLR